MKRSKEELDSHYKKRKLDTINEKYIDYISPSSLQSMAVISIAVRLWTEPDIKKDLEEYYFQTRYSQGTKVGFKKLKEKVLNKLSLMCLPKSLELGVQDVMRPIVLQLLRCFDYKDADYYPFYDLFKNQGTLYWTAEGKIDKAKSLRELVKNGYELKNVERLFYLCCQYCLEDCVVVLWKQLSHANREEMFVERDVKLKGHVIVYWTCLLKDEMATLFNKIRHVYYVRNYDAGCSANQNMVSLSIFAGNFFAVKYFWYKLTDHERISHTYKWLVQVIVNSTHREIHTPETFKFQECYEYTDILCFLLSNLGDEIQLKEFFQKYSFFVLRSLFFCWPYQRFVAPTITVMFDFLKESEYIAIMSEIYYEIGKSRRTHELFREIWLLSPMNLRQACFRARGFKSPIFRTLVWKFISVGDLNTIFVIFDDIACTQKSYLVKAAMIYRKTMFDMIYSKKLGLLDKVASLSMSAKAYNDFKQIILEQADSIFCDLTCKGAFQEAKQFLEWGYQTPEKIKEFKKHKIDPVKLLYRLMYGDSENLNQFAMWYFETKNAVCKFKKSFILKTTELNEWRMVVLNFSRRFRENSWQRFEDFINWCIKGVYTSRKISHFKRHFLKSIMSVLYLYNFDFASKCLSWCLDSTAEVCRFKNELITSSEVVDLLIRKINIEKPDWERVSDVIGWFSPLSDVAVDTLNFTLSEKNVKEDKLKLLNNFICCFRTDSCNKDNVLSARWFTVDLTIDDCTDSEDDGEMILPFRTLDPYYFI